MKEMKIGERIQLGFITVECTPTKQLHTCDNCIFDFEGCYISEHLVGPCIEYKRSDRKDVYFREILKEEQNEERDESR